MKVLVGVNVGVKDGVKVNVAVAVGLGVNVAVLVGVSVEVALGVKDGSRQTGVESLRLRGSRVSPCSS